RLDDAWFRMADIDHAEFLDCDLRRADFYAATVRRIRFLGCDLTGAEFSRAVVTALRLERSTVDELGGIGGLRDIVLSPDQVVSFALAFLASFDITVDDPDD
ncbi:MAG: pentapeptide repeat-containing protein, partial [Acidimicrobiales bacterium]